MEDKVVYRILLNSANKISGDNQTANYLVKIPHTVIRGQLFVETLAIENAGTLFNTATGIRVISRTFTNAKQYSTDEKNYPVIAEIALMDQYFVNDDLANEFHYTRIVNEGDAGFPVVNRSLDNQFIQISLTDTDNDDLAAAQIAGYSLTLCIIDYEPIVEQM